MNEASVVFGPKRFACPKAFGVDVELRLVQQAFTPDSSLPSLKVT